MASTISAATLTVTLQESITLNGVDYGEFREIEIGSINEVSSRIVNVPTSKKTVAIFSASTVGVGQHLLANVKYLRITNLDDTNYVEVIITRVNEDVPDGFGGTTPAIPGAIFKLEAGKSILVGTGSSGFGVEKHANGSTEVASANFGNLSKITVKANTAAVDVQVFVAST